MASLNYDQRRCAYALILNQTEYRNVDLTRNKLRHTNVEYLKLCRGNSGLPTELGYQMSR